ncbi:hypothetical protein NEOC84_000613|uniref:tetratricopeptide repeat protein n=1 Tax=Neochlamydia sp. AcF84 TaxID=2315858 RepID=UPI0014089A4D|nr:tetratricopeptide repeat protein [Neochlamydia sp. AcF84]NGY94722.1 hypothetical protein [Neochlamydia sp. AcF84]
MISDSSPIKPVVRSELKTKKENSSSSLENSIRYGKIDLKICAELSLQDLCSLRLVCKEWKQIVEATDLWKRLYITDFKFKFPPIQQLPCSVNKKETFKNSPSFTPLSSKIYEQLLLSFDNLTDDELREILESNSFLSKDTIEKAEKAYTLALELIVRDKDHIQDPAQQNITIQEGFCIEKLGDIYGVKETSETLLQAAGLYNYAMHLSSVERHEILKEKVAKIQSLLSQLYEQKTLNYDLLRNQFEGNRQKLKDFRSKIEKEIQSLPETPAPQVVRELYGEISQQIKAFFEMLVKQSINILGAEPCEYAMIGFGSLAREEMTPYSDLEFGILIKEDTSKNREYFKRLSALIHLKIINLGETILPALNIPCLKAIDFFDGLTPRGFAFDGAGVEGKGCKTPFGNLKTFELIQTPDKMAQYIAKDEKGQWWHEKEPHLPMELLSFTLLLGNPELIEQYRQKIQEKLDTPYQKGLNLRDYLAKYHLAQVDMATFDPGLGNLGSQGMLFKVKNDFYRFPHLALDRLALITGIEDPNTFDRIEKLNKQSVLTIAAAKNLKKWMSIALFMRLKTYSHYQAQKEMMNPLIKPFGFEDSELIKKHFALNREALKKIKKIYRIFIPFQKAIQEFLLGNESKLKSSSLNDCSPQIRGEIALRLFQQEEAKDWYLKALRENSKNTEVLHSLGAIYLNQGKLEKAAKYAKQALTFKIKLFDKNHSSLSKSYNNLGVVYQEQGKLRKAADLINQALDIDFKLFGEDSPFIAIYYNNLGSIYHEQGKLEKAIKSIQQALAIRLKLFGKNHPMVAICYNNLGTVYQEQGNFEKAADCINQALSIELELFGESHPTVATDQNNLGMIYVEQGKLEKAAKCVNQALHIDFKLFGEDHPKIARDYNNLGTIYRDQGDLEKAAECFKKAFTINHTLFGENHSRVAKDYGNLAHINQDQGNLEKAAEYAIRALDIVIKLFGVNYPTTATCYNNLGTIYKDQMNLEMAAECFKKALAIDLKLFGNKHFTLADRYNNLGMLYYDQGKLKEAAEYVHQALTITLKLLDKNHPKVAIIYNNLGIIYRDQKNLEKATEYFNQALVINLELFGENHPNMAILYNNVGAIYQAIGNTKKVAEFAKKALNISLKIFGKNHPMVAVYYHNLGMTYYHQGKLEKAATYVNQAATMSLKLLGEKHPKMIILYTNLSIIYQSQRNLEKAIEYALKAYAIPSGQ